MKSAPRLLLLTLFLAAPLAAQTGSTVTLTGTVTDGDGRPIASANVFIAGSQRGTAADAQGRYRLGGVPLGAQRLVASSVGYETEADDLVLRKPGEVKTVNFRLKRSSAAVGEVTVESERDERWQRRYERFARRFLGESANAAETKILNPYILDFEERLGTLKATAREPLVIENRALGYRIRYVLTDFEARPNYNFFHGEPLFEEMTPADEAERIRWQANRRKAYLGSTRHLLRSLVAGNAEAQGFHLYLLPNPGMGGGMPGLGGRREQRFPTTPDEILKPARQAGEHVLKFPGILQVIYDQEREEREYLTREWAREARGPADVQTSELRFPTGESAATLDRFGEELDPRSITVSGYMAFERFAEELPKEYGLAESGLPGAAEAAQALQAQEEDQ